MDSATFEVKSYPDMWESLGMNVERFEKMRCVLGDVFQATFLSQENGRRGVFGIGLTNAVPVVGDWNGDGIDEIGIYQQGLWYLDKNRSWQWEGEPSDQFVFSA